MTLNVTLWDGQPIATPGIYRGIPIELYHQQLTAEPSISSSGLRTIFDESPAHYYARSYLNPDREPETPSEALTLGRGAHHLLLGEEHFSERFAIRPEKLNGEKWNSNRTDCKAWLKHCRDLGQEVLLPAQIKAIRGMARGLAAHPMVAKPVSILNGLIEHSIVWRDKETGVWLKVRPDAVPASDSDVADLKTTVSVDREKLQRTIADYSYHVQGGLVGMAFREVLGREMTSFNLVFVEKTPPYCVSVVSLKPADLQLGESIVRAALRTFANCLDTGHWPGPGGDQTDAEFIEITDWTRKRHDARLALLEQGLTP